MAVIIKNLAKKTLKAGDMSGSPAPGPGKAWIVKNLMLTNRETTACTIDLKAVGMFIAPPGMTIGPKSTVVFNDELTLKESGEELSITVTGVSTVGLDYVVNGVERDV